MMPAELKFLGLLNPNLRSEIHRPGPDGIDRDYLRRFSRDHEHYGFDGVLVGAGTEMADSLQLAAFAATQTERLRFLIAHRPGPMHPTLAARQFATLDHLSQGRVTLHAISSRDGETGREGDTLNKDERYLRTEEHLRILKQAWTSPDRFDFEGRFYQFKGFHSEVLSYQKPRIPISFAGDSAIAQRIGAEHADEYSLYAQPTDVFAGDVERLKNLAAGQTRDGPLRFTLIVRLIVGRTEAAAWRRAESILQRARQSASYAGRISVVTKNFEGSQSLGDQRLAKLSAGEARHGKALWTGIVAVTGRANSAALVGTPEIVAEALLEYADLGVSNFITHGFEPYEDVIDYGRHVIPLVRQEARIRYLPGIAAGEEPDSAADRKRSHA